MRTLTKFKSLAATLALVAGLAAAPANAAFISGSIGFGGLFTPTGGTGLADATGIDIGFSTVIAASGDLMPAMGSPATFAPLEFAPSNTPLTPFWSVLGGDFTFDMLSVSVDFQTSSALNLSGSGVLRGVGFDATPGAWTFSGDSLGVFFTFSSITAATPIDEPATLLLLGLGLTGIAVARRKRAA